MEEYARLQGPLKEQPMKRKIVLIAIAGALAFFGTSRSVFAITYGTVPSDQVSRAVNNASGNQDLTISLFDVAAGGTVTDLATTVTTDGSAVHVGNALYFTNSTGLYKQLVGATTATTIRSGANFVLKERQNNTLVVSNKATTGKGSFVYNVETGTMKYFSSMVREIKAASLVKGGAAVALLAKNGNGKQKIFLSGGLLANVDEYPLPKYATSCAGIVLSPNKKMLFVGCAYNVPGKTKGRRGYSLLAVDANGTMTEKRTMNDQTVGYATWLSNTRLITIASSTGGYSTLYDNTVGANRIASTATIGSAFTTVIGAHSVLAVPFQIIRNSSTAFWYSYLWIDVNDTTAMGTFLGVYDVAAPSDQVLLNDATFTYYTDMQ